MLLFASAVLHMLHCHCLLEYLWCSGGEDPAAVALREKLAAEREHEIAQQLKIKEVSRGYKHL